MANATSSDSISISHEFPRNETFTRKFQFDILLNDFAIKYRNNKSNYTETFKRFVVGDKDVIFDVEVTATSASFSIKLLRRSQRLTDVTVTNCTADPTGYYGPCKGMDFLPGVLIAGNEETTFSTIILRSQWANSKYFITNYLANNSEQTALTISGLIIYNNPLRSTLLSELGELMKENCDINIVVGGDKTFPGHKWLLSGRCDFFKKMLETKMKESCENLIELPEDDPDVFEQVLLFLYTDSCPKISTMATDLLLSADKYNIQGLRILCEEELMKTMNKDNICDYLVKSRKANSSRISDKCMDFFVKNISDITRTDNWKEMKNAEHSEMFADIIEKIGKIKT